MGLTKYWQKRNFAETREPEGKVLKKDMQRFVVQEHHATRLHFDFRLEMEGVLRSWAVPKGPSMNPLDKRLAMMVEDHPVSYIGFSGEIAEGNYGAGEVRVWDHGKYKPLEPSNAAKGVRDGKFTFILYGKKLKGEFHMVRTGPENQWLMFKARDAHADEEWQMKQILNYGARSERGKRQRTAKEKPMLAKLLNSSQQRKKAAEVKEKKKSGIKKLTVTAKEKKTKRELLTKPVAKAKRRPASRTTRATTSRTKR